MESKWKEQATTDLPRRADEDRDHSEVPDPDREPQQAPDEQPPTPAQDRVFSLKLSTTGLVVGAFLFALSLQPSLLPRPAIFQGVVSGITLMVGYGLGVLVRWTWHYLGLPTPHPTHTVSEVLVGGIIAIVGLTLK